MYARAATAAVATGKKDCAPCALYISRVRHTGLQCLFVLFAAHTPPFSARFLVETEASTTQRYDREGTAGVADSAVDADAAGMRPGRDQPEDERAVARTGHGARHGDADNVLHVDGELEEGLQQVVQLRVPQARRCVLR